MIKIAIIGFGFRIRHMYTVLKSIGKDVELVGICDTDLATARQNAAAMGLDTEKIIFASDAERLLDGAAPDGVMIGTRCSTHTPMALRVLSRGIALFLEKPVAISDEQLGALIEVARRRKHKVIVSFPLRLSPWIIKTKELIDAGAIGKVEHVQAVNNVPYGHVYFQSWYRDNAETGGLFLQKATHDFDYINLLVGKKPVAIAAMTGKNVFTGNHRSGLSCKDCGENRTCKESPYNPDFIVIEGEWMRPEQHMCAFAPDAGNEDCGSALIRYEGGVHAAYSQNFFVKHKAASRGARLMGYDGTLEFDWYTDTIRLCRHHIAQVETFPIGMAHDDGHAGGDLELARNFIEIIEGTAESRNTLEEGILSASMCLAARQSAQTATFVPLVTF